MTQRRVALGGIALVAMIAWTNFAFAAKTGEWLFEEGSGTVAHNTGTIGAAGDGTLSGATGTPAWVPGLYKGSTSALQFNFNSGTAAYDATLLQRVALGVPNDYIRNAPGATLLAWVRVDSGLNATRTFFAIDNEATAARANIQMINNGQFRVLGRKGAESSSSTYVTPGGTTTPTITAGQTYFVAGVFDYAAGDMLLYLNGQLNSGGTKTLRAEYTAAGNSADLTNARAVIGSNTAQAGEQFFGAIDGVRVYNEVLSAQQILSIYNAEVVPEPAAIVLAATGVLGLLAAYRRRMKPASATAP